MTSTFLPFSLTVIAGSRLLCGTYKRAHRTSARIALIEAVNFCATLAKMMIKDAPITMRPHRGVVMPVCMCTFSFTSANLTYQHRISCIRSKTHHSCHPALSVMFITRACLELRIARRRSALNECAFASVVATCSSIRCCVCVGVSCAKISARAQA